MITAVLILNMLVYELMALETLSAIPQEDDKRFERAEIGTVFGWTAMALANLIMAVAVNGVSS